jgi:MFS transporter, DHA1 family, multidrug resistance protein
LVLRGRLAFLSFYAIFYIARGMSTLIIPLYFVAVGIPVISVGIAIAISGASLLFFEILWGILLDRIGPRPLVFTAVALTSLTYLLIPFVRTFEAAALAEFALGASGPVIAVVARSGVIRESEPGSWASGFGIIGSAFAIAQLSGSLLGTIGAPSIGFVYCFYLSAALSFAAYLVYLLFVERGRLAVVQRAPGPDSPAAGPRPSLDWRGLPLLGIVAVPTFIGYAFFTSIIQLVVTQTPSISGSEASAGFVVSAFWFSTAFFQPVLSARGARRASIWIASALLASFGLFAAMTQLYSIWELVVGAVVEGVCFSVISPLSLSLLMLGMPRRYAGRAMGFYGAAEDIGLILGPLLGSAVWVEFGLNAAYLTLGAIFLAVFIPYLGAMWRRASVQAA